MVTITIVKFSVKRVLIDTGSSSNILLAKAFDQLSISRDKLRLVATLLVGFNRSTTKLLRMIELQF